MLRKGPTVTDRLAIEALTGIDIEVSNNFQREL